MLDIYNLGVASRKPGVAMLWRHLAHWPGLLALIYFLTNSSHDESSGRISSL